MNKLLYILFFSVLAVKAQTPLSSSEATALKKQVQEQAQKTQTMTVDFVQLKHMDFLSNDIETSGNLSFKKPNLVKWQYLKPFRYSVLFKDQTLYIDDDGKKSDVNLSSNKLFGQLNNLIVNSITGDLFQEQDFEITYFKVADGSEVVFIPKDSKLKKYLSQFHIFFSVQAYVSQVKLVEPSGDYTSILFSNRTVNKPIADAVFTH